MKTKLFAFITGIGLALLVAGCVGTVDGRKKAAVPFVKDQVTGHYERPLAQVFNAAREVMTYNGTLHSESTIHGETNTVRSLNGKVNTRSVWIRLEQADPKITSVTVQTRTKAGTPDIDLAHELEKQIALRLR